MRRNFTITHILIFTTLFSFIFLLWGINSWKFSYVGDEWETYRFALGIARDNFTINPFQMNGVYGENPVLGSIYQAIYLFILGDNNIAWRLSNIFLIIPLSFIFFKWVKLLSNTSIAIVSTIFLQFSFYIANFFKIGYINPQALLLMVIALYLVTLLNHKTYYLYGILLGITLGVSFYIYIGPLFPFFIAPFIIQFLFKKISYQKKFLILLSIVLPYFLLVLPGILQMTHFEMVSKKTIMQREFSEVSQIGKNILNNFILFYKNSDYFYNHFVAGPYLDFASRVFAVFGIIFCITLRRKYPLLLTLLLTYAVIAVVIGLVSPYSYSPTTRGIFFLPFGFIFSAIGLMKISELLNTNKLLIVGVITIIVSNIYLSQWGVFNLVGHSTTALIIKELQNKSNNTVFLLTSDENVYQNHEMNTLLHAYKIKQEYKNILHSQINCDSLNNSVILTIDTDISSLNYLDKNTCKTTYSTKIISPTMHH